MNFASLNRTAGALMVLFLAAGSVPGAAQERELLSEDSAVILDLQGEKRLQIHRLRGAISIRVGRPGELRYMARAQDSSREQRNVALWLEGRTLHLEPVEGQEDQPLIVEIAASPELAADVRLNDGKLMLRGLEGGVTVKGQRLDVQSNGLLGSADLEIEGGSVRLNGAMGDVTVAGSKLELDLGYIEGFVSVAVSDSKGEIQEVKNGCELDLVESELVVNGVRGRETRVEATGGSVTLIEINNGARISVDETPLTLQQARGIIEVDTNSGVDFNDLNAQLVVRGSYGGFVRGTGNQGSVDVLTSGAEVSLTNISSTTRVSGDELQVRLSQIKGDTHVTTRASQVRLERIEGAVVVENDFGNVAVAGASADIRISNRDGDVSVTGLAAPIDVQADGNEVRVQWVQVPSEGDSKVVNDRGDVWVRFPPNAGCRLEAEAGGDIESLLPDIRVSEDAHYANGNVGRRNRPTIRVKAGGNLHIEPFQLRKPPQ